MTQREQKPMPDLTLIEKLRQIAEETGSAELAATCTEAADSLEAYERALSSSAVELRHARIQERE